MIGVEMEISEGVDEFLRLQPADLGHHEGEQGVGGDIEGDSEEKIGATLVELATELAVSDLELK